MHWDPCQWVGRTQTKERLSTLVFWIEPRQNSFTPFTCIVSRITDRVKGMHNRIPITTDPCGSLPKEFNSVPYSWEVPFSQTLSFCVK